MLNKPFFLSHSFIWILLSSRVSQHAACVMKLSLYCASYDSFTATTPNIYIILFFNFLHTVGIRSIFTYIYHHHHHHHHIVLAARISLTLSRHSSLSFIALGRSSGQQPVSSHSCWMYVRAGRPAFARPCVGIHKSTSLMSYGSESDCMKKVKNRIFAIRWIYFNVKPTINNLVLIMSIWT